MVLIVGKCINRGAGYHMELTCEFKFQGDKFSLKKENFDVL